MADRKANLLVTMVFDENLDIRKQINTELELKNEITKDLQHLVTGREIKHYVIADDEVINEKLTQERQVGKWILIDEESNTWQCSHCIELGNKDNWWKLNSGTPQDNKMDFCPHCGAKMRGCENG